MTNRTSWFGIDFGTTNSAAVSFTGTSQDNLEQITYGDNEGRPMPSVVAVNKETGEVLVGREAKNKRNSRLYGYHYFGSIKTILDSDEKWKIAGKSLDI